MADPPTTLRAYIAALQQAPVIPSVPHEEWAAHVERISVPARIAEVTEEQWDYWLDVLPPKWMHGGCFCFGEGADAFRLFWFDRARCQYLCRQLTWDETVRFCELAGIPLPS